MQPPGHFSCRPVLPELYYLSVLFIVVVYMGFPGGSVVKTLPAMQETQVLSLSWEDPLQGGMATHSGTLAWRISWTEEPGRPQSMGSQGVGHDRVTKPQQWQCVSVSHSLPSYPSLPLSPGNHKLVFYICHSYFSFVGSFTYTLFLDSTYK